MRNIRLLIEYDGTGYAGWQIQPTEKTVQGTIRDAIEKMTGGGVVSLLGASRTDAGVHALGQVANFKTDSDIPVEDFERGLNSILPEDIVIKDVAVVSLDFDSMRDAEYKSYLYRILNQPLRAPLERNRSWHVSEPLYIGAMREGAKHLVGEKDFTSFRAAGSEAPHSVREILSFDVSGRTEKKEGLIELRVTGTGFLRYMVRIMAAMLVKVGRGELEAAEIEGIIEAKDRTAAPATAPPGGLYLLEVKY